MKKEGVYNQWRSIKQHINSKFDEAQKLYKKDYDRLKLVGQKPQQSNLKYGVYGFTVMFIIISLTAKYLCTALRHHQR